MIVVVVPCYKLRPVVVLLFCLFLGVLLPMNVQTFCSITRAPLLHSQYSQYSQRSSQRSTLRQKTTTTTTTTTKLSSRHPSKHEGQQQPTNHSSNNDENNNESETPPPNSSETHLTPLTPPPKGLSSSSSKHQTSSPLPSPPPPLSAFTPSSLSKLSSSDLTSLCVANSLPTAATPSDDLKNLKRLLRRPSTQSDVETFLRGLGGGGKAKGGQPR